MSHQTRLKDQGWLHARALKDTDVLSVMAKEGCIERPQEENATQALNCPSERTYQNVALLGLDVTVKY